MAHSSTPAVIEGISFLLNWEKVGAIREFYDFDNIFSVNFFLFKQVEVNSGG